ncbi:GNAT family N-acetyltransferase [Emcibacter sp.]|uniref:GNAT family N-acetyltransferase n=1 Tax=Emcibacter sp. TaxID=1979954 RepID=UPI002AA900CC|nr:GNAT family N-acetyltransferase [Emcibacter sp.]
MISIRPAVMNDASIITTFLHRLAEHDGHGDQCHITEEQITRFGFSPEKCFDTLIIEVNDEPQGLALFYMTFSVWNASPILFLSDLYVNENCRGLGLGQKLFAALAKTAMKRGCKRMEWQVLPEAAAVGFYKSFGARRVDDFHIYRLDGDNLKNLADNIQSKSNQESLN